MPSGWLEELWEIAVNKRFAYLKALAAPICTGARPSEVCLGVAARAAGEGGLTVVFAVTKVTAAMGQPWRKLSMVVSTDAVRHILVVQYHNERCRPPLVGVLQFPLPIRVRGPRHPETLP